MTTNLGLLGVPSTDYYESPQTESAGFHSEKQKFTPSNLVTLFELDTTDLGGEILRFTSSALTESAAFFGGKRYAPIPVEASGFEITSTGTLPTPTLRVLNTPTFLQGVISLGDLIGATLTRIRTFRTFLDDGATPDSNAHYPLDIYVVDRKASQNKVFIEWELAASIDQEGKMIPGRQILRDYCSHLYRRWDVLSGTFDYTKASCPYAGGSSYDVNNNPVTSANDVCSKNLTGCRKRFGDKAELPIRAFPGVARVR